jgi:hypothetical protein
MKVKIAAVTFLGMLLIVCATLSHYQADSTVLAASTAMTGGAGFFDFDPADSEINIGGGSIYGKLKNQQAGWTIISAKEVHAKSANIGTIVTKGIDNVPNTVDVKNGWVIFISNKKKQDGSEYPSAVMIYSDASCKGKSLDPNQIVCLKTRSDSRWSVFADGSLHFHDRNCDGTTGTTEDRACDYLLKVRIQSPKGHDVASGMCTDGTCQIGIGTP